MRSLTKCNALLFAHICSGKIIRGTQAYTLSVSILRSKCTPSALEYIGVRLGFAMAIRYHGYGSVLMPITMP